MNYFKKISRLFTEIEVRDKTGKSLMSAQAVRLITRRITGMNKDSNKIILIGNGGSASIASHIATDFLKNAGLPAIAFNDASLLTCLSNDLGYEHVFEKPLSILARKGDILFAISSSGMSKNILKATQKAKAKGCFVVSLSGFTKGNLLRNSGDVNFYVPTHSYGEVEITHLAICHLIADSMI